MQHAQPKHGYAAPVDGAASKGMPGGGSYCIVTATSPVGSSRSSCSRSAFEAFSTSPPTTMHVRLATVGPLSGTSDVVGSTTATMLASTPSAPAAITIFTQIAAG